MKVNLAKSAGFCFGVKRAIEIAFRTAQVEKNIIMLGDIVHNEEVTSQINKVGIKKIKRLNQKDKKTLLIPAHGAPLRIYEQAKKLGCKIVDATCPMVKEIHKLAQRAEQKGYNLIIIGDKLHDEVNGISGQLRKKTIIIDPAKKIPKKKIKGIKKGAVVVQSTQNIKKTIEIVNSLKQYIKELKFFNTICRPTRIKQEEIQILPKQNDIMIIIGSKTSANTKRLYQISKSLNKRSYWVQSKNDLKKSWFRKAETVGVTAGASTPDYTTKAILDRIKKFSC